MELSDSYTIAGTSRRDMLCSHARSHARTGFSSAKVIGDGFKPAAEGLDFGTPSSYSESKLGTRLKIAVERLVARNR